jgi:hypothetical protein
VPEAREGTAFRLGRQCFVMLALVLCPMLFPARAGAQTTTAAAAPVLTASQITRLQPYRSTAARRYWISYADCVADDAFNFPLGLSDVSHRLEVWVGNDDCAEKRGLNDRGQCWLVAANDRPMSPTTNISVPVRNVIRRNLESTDPPTNTLPESVCEGSTDPEGEKVTFYFLLVEGGKSVASTTWTNGDEGTGYDLVGPTPPGNISVGVGESQLAITLRSIGEETDRERFEAFCVPAGTTGAVLGDAGVAPSTSAARDDAGTFDFPGAAVDDVTGGGTPDASAAAAAAPAECFTPLMVAGQRPPFGFSCGVADETSRTLRTGRLANDTAYAVGVSGQDVLGNAGVLSSIQCGTPVVLEDFYERYVASGGLGGGGFCNLSGPPRQVNHRPLFGLGLLSLALLWRRGRSGA